MDVVRAPQKMLEHSDDLPAREPLEQSGPTIPSPISYSCHITAFGHAPWDDGVYRQPAICTSVLHHAVRVTAARSSPALMAPFMRDLG